MDEKSLNYLGMNNKRLLVVGELNVDLILNDIRGFPKIGNETLAGEMEFTLGSSAAIMASNISAMGTDTTFCGKIGHDKFGEFLKQELQKRKVSTRYISTSDTLKTGITVVMNYEQDCANLTFCGAMEALNIKDIPWEDLKEYDHFHFSNYFLQKGIQKDITEIFKRMKEAGLTTSLDLQVDPDDKWEFDYKNTLPFVDIFLPNYSELLSLCKKNDLTAAITHIRDYANVLVIKMGEQGARLITGEQEYRQGSLLNKDFKDAVGAGDSFNAGFIHKYLNAASWENCLKYANLMGSLNTTRAGGTAAFTSAEEIRKKADEIKKRVL